MRENFKPARRIGGGVGRAWKTPRRAKRPVRRVHWTRGGHVALRSPREPPRRASRSPRTRRRLLNAPRPRNSQKLNALKRPQAVVWVASTVSTHRARRGTSAASAPPPPPGWAWACAPGRRAASAAPASADPSSARTSNDARTPARVRCRSAAASATNSAPPLLHLTTTLSVLFYLRYYVDYGYLVY